MYYGGPHKHMTDQEVILQLADATQGITGLLEVKNSSLSASGVATQAQAQDFGDKQYILVNKAGLSTFKQLSFSPQHHNF